MKKDNIIIILLLLIILMLGYQTVMLRRISQPEASEKELTQTAAPARPQAENEPNPYENADLKTEVFRNEDKTYGYKILLNGSPMIRQPNIPGLPGNAGFPDAEKAEKTAALVMLKIRKNIMPPAVTTKELDSLGVL